MYMYAQFMRIKNVRIQKASSPSNVLLQLNDFNKLPDLIGVQCVDWWIYENESEYDE